MEMRDGIKIVLDLELSPNDILLYNKGSFITMPEADLYQAQNPEAKAER